jgi:hypothetical protein
MATTYYARANLNDLGDATGYSLTSGGPSAGVKPALYYNDIVIFDQNSGPSRSISGAWVNSGVQLQMLASSNPMDFAGALYLTKDCIVKGTAAGIVLCGSGSAFNGASYNLDASQCVVGAQGLRMASGDSYWTIVGNFTTTGGITLSGTSYDQDLFFTAGAIITCSAISVTGSGTNSYATLYTGYGITIVVTGAPPNNGGNVCNISSMNGPGTTTVILTDKGPMAKSVLLLNAAGVSWNFVNNTGNGQGTGGVQFNTTHVFSTYDCGKGAVNNFGGGYSYTAANWIMDGAGQYNTIVGFVINNVTAASLIKSGGGTIAANFCSFSAINATGSPATAIRATNSKMTGSTGITLVGQTSRTMVFL